MSDPLPQPSAPSRSTSWYADLPVCVRFPLLDAELDRTADGVHQLIRMIAAYETFIKCLGSVAHAVAVESGFAATTDYATRFQERFIGKYPSLGDYLWLLDQHKKRVWTSGPTWFQDIAERLHEQRFAKKTAGDSMVFRLCRAIERHRQSLVRGEAQVYPSAVSVLSHFVTFRNTCFHGSITIRFAKKFDQLLIGALSDISQHLRLSQEIRFVVPLGFARQDSSRVVAIDPENPTCAPHNHVIGDRPALKWEELYVGPRDSESLEEFVRLTPLVIYDRTLDDFRFLNRFEKDEFEYLSHRSGDLDFVSLSDAGWQDAFGLRIVESLVLPSEDEGSSAKSGEGEDKVEVPEEPSVVTGDADAALKADLERLLATARDDSRIDPGAAKQFFAGLAENEIERIESLLLEHSSSLSRDALVDISKLLYSLGLHETALNVLKDLRPRFMHDAELAHLLGRSLVMLGKREKSAAKTHSDSTRRTRAIELLSDGVKALNESLELGAGENGRRDVFTLSMLVDAYCRLGDFSKAMEACDRGLSLEPENDRLNSQRLYLYERTGS